MASAYFLVLWEVCVPMSLLACLLVLLLGALLQWYVPTLRTWANSTFTSALSDTRSPAEKEQLADELFSRCVGGRWN